MPLMSFLKAGVPTDVTSADPLPIAPPAGGEAATIADGADVTQGAKADAAVVNPATSASVIALLKGLLTQLLAATPAGSAVVGKVGIDQTTPGTTNRVFLQDLAAGEYETVAASQTAQVIGATGAVGDYLAGLLVVPASLSPGAVTVADGDGSAVTVFAGGTTSLTTLTPFFVPLAAKCVNATTPGWKVTTGVGVSVFATGNFT